MEGGSVRQPLVRVHAAVYEIAFEKWAPQIGQGGARRFYRVPAEAPARGIKRVTRHYGARESSRSAGRIIASLRGPRQSAEQGRARRGAQGNGERHGVERSEAVVG